MLLCALVAFGSGCVLGTPDAATLGGNDVPAEAGSPDDPIPAWSLAQQGTEAGVKWSIFTGDSAKQHLRCISLDLDPKPPSLFPPLANLVHPVTGETIPPPPPLSTVASEGGRQHSGCAPAPSLTSMSSQPLNTLSAHQPDGGKGTYSYAAGTLIPEIRNVTAEFTDGTTAPAAVSQGTFIVIYPPSKKLVALRPMVPKFPDLRCSAVEVPTPPIPGGGPSFTIYGDGGCTGYTVRFGPFGR